ncbi:helix-turn-helix transcriptional regulator [Enterobacter hormaechei]|nr:helix-turn-helix transcriptional regulator [Enterobacter hormaechei]
MLRHMKQSHLAELMGVDQATVSRWERGTLALSDGRWSAVLQLLTGPSDSSYDAALKRLVQSSAHKVHLVATGHIVCSRHLRPRQRELRIDLAELLGKSLRVYASPR